MIPVEFTTRALSRHQQVEAWCAWHGSVFDVIRSPVPADKGLPATHLNWKLGSLGVSHVSAPAVHTERTKAVIRRNPIDHWVVTLSKGDTVEYKVRGSSVTVPAGVPFIYSMGDEMASTRSGPSRDRYFFYLSRDDFQSVAVLLDAARGTALTTPGGKLLADYMNLLVSSLPDLAPEDGSRLATAVEAILGACLAPSADRLAFAEKPIDTFLRERVRRAVRKHLRSPSLNPDRLCRELATSRSQLYRLLDGEGGVSHYIQRQRLSESFTLLCNASNILPVAKIAELLCFADASNFSRAFRREFGMSPSDARAASMTGPPPGLTLRKDTRHSGVRTFGDCLRGLRDGNLHVLGRGE
ncbi:MAG TPA: helix-turn-helix domain-containing protein [Reyranella sp.]|jgi:AraC-like DNA-binding protein|nr:helix-turn-helix domain-containing protein [Reyranella sp.]